MLRTSAFLLLLLVLSAAAASAQLAVDPGDRVSVRLSLEAANRFAVEPQLVGEVVSVTSDTLTLERGPDLSPLAIPIVALERLDRSLGVPSRVQNALKWGALTAALGAVRMPLMEGEEEDNPLFSTVQEGAIVGAALGSLVGAVVGALVREERWEPLRLPHDATAVPAEITFPRVMATGGRGFARSAVGTGDGSYGRVGVGLIRLGDELQLRGELMVERSSLEGDRSSCTRALEGYCLARGQEIRRIGSGLTLVAHLGTIGRHVQLYAPFGLGMVRSHVETEEIQGCYADGRYVSCADGPPLETLRVSRDATGVGANLGVGVLVNFRGLGAFVEVRQQVMDESASEPAHFVPISVGVAF